MQASVIHPSLYVEPATVEDIPFIMSVERSPGYPALVGSYGSDEHRRRLEAPNSTYLLCRIGTELVGFAVIRRDDDGMGTAQLHRVAVAPAGRGHGSAFLREICRRVFAVPEIERLWLDLLPSNMRASRVYRKLGFVEEGTLRAALRLSDGSRRDLILMSLLREQWTGARTSG